MKAKHNKKKKSNFPSFIYILIAIASGLALRNVSFNVTSYVYLAGIFVVFVVPYFIIVNQDAQMMRQTEELARSLQGE